MPGDLDIALRIRADLQNAVRQLDKLQSELKQTGRGGRTAARGAREAAAGLDRVEASSTRAALGMSRVRAAATGAGFLLLARQAVRAVDGVKDVGIAFEALDRRAQFAVGSIAAGVQEIAFVRAEADRLGISFRAAGEGYTSLAAAARGTNIEGATTREIFTAISEAAAVLELSAEQTGGALTAIEQIISKGKVSAEELRQQLGERLPGAFQIAARAMGVTTQELDKMLEQGQLLAEDFLPLFAAEVRRTFSGDVPAAARWRWRRELRAPRQRHRAAEGQHRPLRPAEVPR